MALNVIFSDIRSERRPRPVGNNVAPGTPLINDVEDFRAIWQFLGWVAERKPGDVLMAALEETLRSASVRRHTSIASGAPLRANQSAMAADGAAPTLSELLTIA